MSITPNSDRTIWTLQLNSRYIRQGHFFPQLYLLLSNFGYPVWIELLVSCSYRSDTWSCVDVLHLFQGSTYCAFRDSRASLFCNEWLLKLLFLPDSLKQCGLSLLTSSINKAFLPLTGYFLFLTSSNASISAVSEILRLELSWWMWQIAHGQSKVR